MAELREINNQQLLKELKQRVISNKISEEQIHIDLEKQSKCQLKIYEPFELKDRKYVFKLKDNETNIDYIFATDTKQELEKFKNYLQMFCTEITK